MDRFHLSLASRKSRYQIKQKGIEIHKEHQFTIIKHEYRIIINSSMVNLVVSKYTEYNLNVPAGEWLNVLWHITWWPYT